jgi:hypothetical protein
MAADAAVAARVAELVAETRLLLAAIADLAKPGVEDPLADPATLARAVALGLMDAPQLRSNRFARGQIATRIIDGACVAVDAGGRPLTERARLRALHG